MILVFGKNGQVASHLSKYRNVQCLDRNEANLENPKQCRLIILKYKPSAVVNAAAYTDVNQAEYEIDLTNKVNTDSPRFMAMACKELKIPFIHISSEYVFDGENKKPNTEDDPTRPLNHYGVTKLAAENLVIETYFKAIILRTSWIFSSFGENFVNKMLNLSETKSEIMIVSDQVGGPTPASSIAQTIIAILKKLETENVYSGNFGLYHYSGWPDVSWADFAREILHKNQKQTKVIDILSKDYTPSATRPINSTLDCSRILRDFEIERPEWKLELAQMLIKRSKRNR